MKTSFHISKMLKAFFRRLAALSVATTLSSTTLSASYFAAGAALTTALAGVGVAQAASLDDYDAFYYLSGGVTDATNTKVTMTKDINSRIYVSVDFGTNASSGQIASGIYAGTAGCNLAGTLTVIGTDANMVNTKLYGVYASKRLGDVSSDISVSLSGSDTLSISAYGLYLGEWAGTSSLSSNISVSCSGRGGTAYGIYLAVNNMGPGVISGDILATADYNAYGIWSNASSANLTFADGASVTATSNTNWGTVNSIATAGGTLLLKTEDDSTTAQVAINGDIYVKGTSTGTYNSATFESGIFNVNGNISCSDLTIDYGSTLSVAESNTVMASSGLTIGTNNVASGDRSACLVLADKCTLDVSGTITLDLTGLSSLSNAEIMLLLGKEVELGENVTGISIVVDDVADWTADMTLGLIYDADGVFDELTCTLTDSAGAVASLNYADIATDVFGYDITATTDWTNGEPYGLQLDGSTASFSYDVEASIDFSANTGNGVIYNAAALYVTGDMDSIRGDVSVSGTSGNAYSTNQAYGIYNTATISSLSSTVTATNTLGSAIALHNEGSLTLDGASLSATGSMVSVALDNAAGATITTASDSSLSATGNGTNIALAASGDLTLSATNDATLSMTGDITAIGCKLTLSSGNYVLTGDATISANELMITAGANLTLKGATTFTFEDLWLDITNYSESDGALLTIADGASVSGSFNLNIVTGNTTSLDFADSILDGTLSTTTYYFYETAASADYYGVVISSDTKANIADTGLIPVSEGSNNDNLIDVTFNTTIDSNVSAPEYGIALEIRGSGATISGDVDVCTSGSTNGFSHIYAVYANSSLNATNLSISGDISVSSDSYAKTYGVWTNASLGTISGSITVSSLGSSYAIYNEAEDATITFGDGASLSASGSATSSHAIYSNAKAITLSTGSNDYNISLTGNIYTSTSADLTLSSGNYSITGTSVITAQDMLINADASLTLNGATTFNLTSLTLDVTGHSGDALLTMASGATVTGLDTITLITGDTSIADSSAYIDGELTNIRYEFYDTASSTDWYYLQANLVATSEMTVADPYPTTAHSLTGDSNSIFDLTIAADITYSDSSKNLNGSALTVTGAYGSIAGDISMLSTGSSNSSVKSKGYAIYASSADITSISTTIDVESTNSYAYGVYLTGSDVDAISSTISMKLTKPTATASGCGFGVYIYENSSVETLSGSISIDASAVSDATVYGVYAAAGSDIGTISGSINVEGGSTLYALYLYGNDSTGNGRTVNFTNGTTLEATGATGSSESYAIYSDKTNLTLTAENDTNVINLTGSISTTDEYDLTLSSGEYRTHTDTIITAKDLTIEAGATLTLNQATTFDVSALWLDVTNYESTDNVLLKIASTSITLDCVNVVTGDASIKSYSDYISDNAGLLYGKLFYFYETADSASSYLTATTLAESSSVSNAMISLAEGESSSDNLSLTVDFDKDSSNTGRGTAVYTNAAQVSIEGNIFVTGDSNSVNDVVAGIYLDGDAEATIGSTVDVSHPSGAAYAIYSAAESITFADGASLTATNALYSTGAMTLNGTGSISMNGLVTINGDLSLESGSYDVNGDLSAADLSITTGASLNMGSGTNLSIDSLTLNVTDLANTGTMLDLSSVSSATGLDLITIELSAEDFTSWDSTKLGSLISASAGLLDDSIVTIYAADVAAEVYGTVIANEPLNDTTALWTSNEESATDLSVNLNAVLDYNSNGGYATALYNTGSLAEFSGDITVTTALTSARSNSYQAHGLYNDGSIVELSGNITVNSEKTDAYGLYTAAHGTVGTISGNISVTGAKANYAFYSNGDTDISFADGVSLSASGGTSNYAIYANQALSMSGVNSNDALSLTGNVYVNGDWALASGNYSLTGNIYLNGDWTLASGNYSLTGNIEAADLLIGSDASLTLTDATSFTVDSLWLDATGFAAGDPALLTIKNGLTGITSLNIITGNQVSLDANGTIDDTNDSLAGAFYYFYETADSSDWYGFTATTAMKDSSSLTYTGLLSLGADEQLDAIVDITFESAGANITQSGTALQVSGANVSIAGDIDVSMTGDGSMNAFLIAVYASKANGAENVTLSGDISVYTDVFAKVYGLYTEMSTGIISGSISAESAHYAYAIYSEAENPTFTFADGASLSAKATSTHSFALYSAGYAMTLETTTDDAQVSFTGSLAASMPLTPSDKYDITVNSGHYTFTDQSTITADTLLIEQGASMTFNGDTTFNVNTLTLNAIGSSTTMLTVAEGKTITGLDSINIISGNTTTLDYSSIISTDEGTLNDIAIYFYEEDGADAYGLVKCIEAQLDYANAYAINWTAESGDLDLTVATTVVFNELSNASPELATALYNTAGATLDSLQGDWSIAVDDASPENNGCTMNLITNDGTIGLITANLTATNDSTEVFLIQNTAVISSIDDTTIEVSNAGLSCAIYSNGTGASIANISDTTIDASSDTGEAVAIRNYNGSSSSISDSTFIIKGSEATGIDNWGSSIGNLNDVEIKATATTGTAYGIRNVRNSSNNASIGNLVDVEITATATGGEAYGINNGNNATMGSISGTISAIGTTSSYAFRNQSSLQTSLSFSDDTTLSATGASEGNNYAIYSDYALELKGQGAAISLTGDVVSDEKLSFTSGTYTWTEQADNTGASMKTTVSATAMTISSDASLVLCNNTDITASSLTIDITGVADATAVKDLLMLTDDTKLNITDKKITVLVDSTTYQAFVNDAKFALELIYDDDMDESIWGTGDYDYYIVCGADDLKVDYDQIAYGFPFIYATEGWAIDKPYATKLDATTYDGQSYTVNLDESISFANQVGQVDYSGAALYNEADLTTLIGSIKLADDTSKGGTESEYNFAYGVYSVGDIDSMEATIEVTNSIGNAIGIYNGAELNMNVDSISASGALISCAIWNNSEATLNFAKDITMSATGGSTANYAIYSDSDLSMTSAGTVTMQGDLNAGANSITLNSGSYEFDNGSATTTITAGDMSIASDASLALSGDTNFAFSTGTLTLNVDDIDTAGTRLSIKIASSVTGLGTINVVLSEADYANLNIATELSFITDRSNALANTSYYIYDGALSSANVTLMDTAFSNSELGQGESASLITCAADGADLSLNFLSTLDFSLIGKATALHNTGTLGEISGDFTVVGEATSSLTTHEGFAINNVGTTGDVSGNISITNDYGQATAIANDGSMGAISGCLTVTASDKAFGIYAASGSMGAVSADTITVSGSLATGLQVDEGASVGDVSSDVTVSSTTDASYGIYLKGSFGAITGNYTVSSGAATAHGITSLSGSTITGDISGSFDIDSTATSDLKAGVYGLSLGGSMTGDFTGSVDVATTMGNATGISLNGSMGALAGSISASSGADDALALYIGATGAYDSISGSLSATAATTATAISYASASALKFGDSVTLSATGAQENIAIKANQNLSIQSTGSVTMTGDMQAAGSIALESGAYSMTTSSTITADSMSIAAGASLTLAGDTTFDFSDGTLTLYVTDLNATSLDLSAVTSLTGLDTINVVLSNTDFADWNINSELSFIDDANELLKNSSYYIYDGVLGSEDVYFVDTAYAEFNIDFTQGENASLITSDNTGTALTLDFLSTLDFTSTGYATALYNTGTLGEISGDFVVVGEDSTRSSNLGYAIYNVGTTGDVTGSVTISNEGGSSYDIYNKGSMGDIDGAELNATGTSAYGLYLFYGANAGELSSNVTVTSTDGMAYGVYLDIECEMGAISSERITVKATDRAYGVYTDSDSTMTGNISSTFDVDSTDGEAYGLSIGSTLDGDFTGSMDVTSENAKAWGILLGGSMGDIAGTGITVTGATSYGLYIYSGTSASELSANVSATATDGPAYGVNLEGELGNISSERISATSQTAEATALNIASTATVGSISGTLSAEGVTTATAINYEGKAALNFGDSVTLRATGAESNYAINSIKSLTMNSTGTVSMTGDLNSGGDITLSSGAYSMTTGSTITADSMSIATGASLTLAGDTAFDFAGGTLTLYVTDLATVSLDLSKVDSLSGLDTINVVLSESLFDAWDIDTELSFIDDSNSLLLDTTYTLYDQALSGDYIIVDTAFADGDSTLTENNSTLINPGTGSQLGDNELLQDVFSELDFGTSGVAAAMTNTGTLGDISSNITAQGENDTDRDTGYGLYNEGSIGSISGDITTSMGSGDAYGFTQVGDATSVGNITGDITASSDDKYSYAIYVKDGSVGDVSGKVTATGVSATGIFATSGTTWGDVSGDISASSTTGGAYGIYVTGGSMGTISSKITVSSTEGAAWGVSVSTAGTVDAITGSITATVDDGIAGGIKLFGSVGVISADITATGSDTSYGILNYGSAAIVFGDSASISATGAEENYAIYSSTDLIIQAVNDNAAVSMTGEIYAKGDLLINEGSFTLDSDNITADTVTLSNDANVTLSGDTTIASGDETLIIEDGASLTAQGSLNAEILTLKDGTAALDNANITQLVGDKDSALSGKISIEGDEESIYKGSYAAATTVTLVGATTATMNQGANLSIVGESDSEVSITGASGGSLSSLNSEGTVKLGTMSESLTLAEKSSITGGTLNVELTEATLSESISSGNPLSLTSGAALTMKDSTLNLSVADEKITTIDLSLANDTGNTLLSLSDNTDSSASVELHLKGYVFSKYFTNIRMEGVNVVADLNHNAYSGLVEGDGNHISGIELVNEALIAVNPQLASNTDGNKDLAAVFDSMDGYLASGNSSTASKLAAAIAGASVTALNSALMYDVERQLTTIRNRAQGRALGKGAAEEGFNAWIQAESGSSRMDDTKSGYHAGHDYTTFGGSIGLDITLTDSTLVGAAFTAMYGDVDNSVAELGRGHLDTKYMSLYARHQSGDWNHRFIAAFGDADAEMNRTITHANGSYKTNGNTEGYSIGLGYELSYDLYTNEEKSAVLHPIFSADFVHAKLNGYTESGSDATLEVGDMSNTYATVGIGIEHAQSFGASIFNRQASLSASVKVAADIGDRTVSSDVSLTSNRGTEVTVKGTDPGTVGLDFGLGINLPVNEKGDSVFLNVNYEVRSKLTEGSATIGYRFSF